MSYNEALVILQEECAEVIQDIAKIFRFGLDDTHSGVSNRTRLENELGDVLALIDILQRMDIISYSNLEKATSLKKEKLKKWSSLGDYCGF